MKNLIAFFLGGSLLIGGGLACKNPLAKYTKQYNCTIAGEPEPQTADGFVSRGYKHIEMNGYADQFDQCAFDAAQEAVRLDSKNADAFALRGNLYRARREYDLALDDLNEAIRLKPGNPIYYFFRSLVYEKKNMLKEAIEDLSVSLKNDASHHSYAKRGSLYFKANDYENALKDYTEAIRLKPDYENHYTMRAEVYRKLGKNAEAEADELKAKEFEDSDSTKPPTSSDSTSTKSTVPKTISGGVVNGKATNLVKPPYPPAARAVRASGAVNVQVTIDEKGDVVAASAVSGHPLLRAAAVQAARASKFTPTLLSGKPVKVTGVVVYNFTPE
jgi:TonB family protein